MIELKNCPFCGYGAQLVKDRDQDVNAYIPKWLVECKVCHAQGSSFSERDHAREACKIGAVQLWNQRVQVKP